MKIERLTTFLLCALLGLTPAVAGIVYEIEVTDHEQSPPRVESTEMAAEGTNIKMEIGRGRSGETGDMIFRGDRREMIVVDHDDRSYTVIDQAAIDQIAKQVSGAMKQMEEALKNVPEGQREMIEKMMKERMPQTQAPSRPASELRKTGERGTHAGYPCVKYDVLRGGEKVRELWVTDWDNVEGGEDVVAAWVGMADFFRDLMDSLPDFGQGGAMEDPAFVHMKEIGGFPVVTREFEGGELESEATLRSAGRRTLDPADFEPPAGYKRRSMMPQ